MASDLTKRLKPLLDAGIELAQLSPVRAEAIVRELVKQGEVRRHEAAGLVQLLVERGRDAGGKAAETTHTGSGKKSMQETEFISGCIESKALR
jgi:polyhydroxyalkanoate synthesis regulator phasin